MVHLDSELAQIGFDNEIEATFMIFKKEVNTQEFIDVHKEVVTMLDGMDKSTGKHYVDTSKISAVSLEAQAWVAENVVPKIQAKGSYPKAKIALVVSDDVFANFAVKNISSKTDSISETVFFDSLDKAKNWLNTQ
ncbi:MAG: hypothetical protein AAFX87_02940 [Bacteroidota bacterium]